MQSRYDEEPKPPTNAILFSNERQRMSHKMEVKRKYLDRTPLSEEEKQVLLKHHIDKASTKSNRAKKAIFEHIKMRPFNVDNPEAKSKLL